MPNPFGLEFGSTPSAQVAEYLVAFKTVPRTHPDFKEYDGMWSPKAGLIGVDARSDVFVDDSRCIQALSLYDKVAKQLETVYGVPEIYESLDADAVYDGDKYFFDSLRNKERMHFRIWNRADGANLDAGIEEIRLSIFVVDHESTQVLLSYEAKGCSDADEDFGSDAL